MITIEIKKQAQVTIEVDSCDIAYLIDALELLNALTIQDNFKTFNSVRDSLKNKYTPNIFYSVLEEFKGLLESIKVFEGW